MSKTVGFSEVKAFNPGYQNATLMNPTKPATPADVCTLGGTFKAEYSHQEWTDGQMKETCYTALFPPNTKVLCTFGGKAIRRGLAERQGSDHQHFASDVCRGDFAQLSQRPGEREHDGRLGAQHVRQHRCGGVAGDGHTLRRGISPMPWASGQ